MTIPDQATCVFRGRLFDVYQWPITDYDGRPQIFEGLRRADAAIVLPLVTRPDGLHVVILREEQPGIAPFWTQPGGCLSPGETPLQAAQRELLEETGLGSDDWALLGSHRPAGKIAYAVHVYVARDCRVVGPTALDGGERIDIVELPWEDWLARLEHAEFRGRDALYAVLGARIPAAVAEGWKKAWEAS